jgi:uncharacterized repeat protein (TIGR01451 family)
VRAARLAVSAHTVSDAGSGALVVGSTVAYTFAVANSGGGSTTASLVDPLPSELAPIDAEADQGSCTTAQRVVCTLGAIAPGQTVTVTVVAQVTFATSFQNPVSVTADPGVVIDAPAGLLTLAAGAANPVAFATAKTARVKRAHAKKAHAKKAAAKRKTARKGAAPAPRKPLAER